MPLSLKIILIIISLFLIISTLSLVRKDKIPVRYSLIWLISSLVLLFVSLFPETFGKLTSLIGFQVSSNFVIGIFIFFLLVITRMLTKVVSEQNKKIIMLIQEISIMKKDKDDEK